MKVRGAILKRLYAIFIFFPFSAVSLLISLIGRPAVYSVVPRAEAQTLVLVNSVAATSLLPAIWINYPILHRIAACESTGDPKGTPRQFNSDGSPLWGRQENASGRVVIVKRDAGLFQINTWAHATEISKMGLDVIHSATDNAAFALHLYKKSGTQPWSASESCWQEH